LHTEQPCNDSPGQSGQEQDKIDQNKSRKPVSELGQDSNCIGQSGQERTERTGRSEHERKDRTAERRKLETGQLKTIYVAGTGQPRQETFEIEFVNKYVILKFISPCKDDLKTKPKPDL
jgi:hypothetical protein